MFHMMNEARIAVGLGAAMLGYAGYEATLEYAKHAAAGPADRPRRQGRDAAAGADHRARRRQAHAAGAEGYCEGALALELYCARLVDEQHTGDADAAARDAALLLEVLTPIAKSWPSEWCLEANSLAIQVHGGYGYTRDFPVEQYWRDNRLNMIHEGTHGIQALDLLGRKVVMDGGAGLKLLAARDRRDDRRARGRVEGLAEHADALAAALQRLGAATKRRLGDRRAGRGARQRDAVPAGLRPRRASRGSGSTWRCAARGPPRRRRPRRRGRLAACRYFFRYELPKIDAWLGVVAARDDTCRTHARGVVLKLATRPHSSTLVWVLIYGGLFGVGLGVALARAATSLRLEPSSAPARSPSSPACVLIWVRSRMAEPLTRRPDLDFVKETDHEHPRPAAVRPRPARPRSSPAARAASACRSPRRSARPARSVLLTLAQGRRPRGVGGAPEGQRGIDARWVAADLSQPSEIARVVAGRDAAPRPRRHPRQQRRRHLGRAGRGPSARGLGQGDEPERALDLPDEPGGRQAQHDPAPQRPHHQRRVDRRPGRQPRRHVDDRLQHQQGARSSTSPARWPANGASTASPSTRSRRASSRAR